MSLRLAQLAKGKSNITRAKMLDLQPEKIYKDGRTKQCFADECDINKIMARAEVTGTIAHITKYEGQYADFSDFDYQTNLNMLTRGREMFDDLPAEIRREFDNNPAAFFAYVNDPKNTKDLLEKLPGLARPGTQLIKTTPEDADTQAAALAVAAKAAVAAASEPEANENKKPDPDPEPEPKE